MSKINVTDVHALVGKKVINHLGNHGTIYLVNDDDHFPIKVEFSNGEVRSYTYHGYEYDFIEERYITFAPSSTNVVISKDVLYLLIKHDISSEELISIILEEYH